MIITPLRKESKGGKKQEIKRKYKWQNGPEGSKGMERKRVSKDRTDPIHIVLFWKMWFLAEKEDSYFGRLSRLQGAREK